MSFVSCREYVFNSSRRVLSFVICPRRYDLLFFGVSRTVMFLIVVVSSIEGGENILGLDTVSLPRVKIGEILLR